MTARIWPISHLRLSRLFSASILVFVGLLSSSQSQLALGQFTQQGSKLVGTGAVELASQGWSVALSGDGNTAIIGGREDNSATGAAWVYTASDGVWTQQGSKLVGTGAVGNSHQGTSVALSADGNTAIVGGPDDNFSQGNNSNVGAAWVFTQSGGVWSQQGSKLVGTGALGNAHQGTSVALAADGNTAIVGAPGDHSHAGAVWVFTQSTPGDPVPSNRRIDWTYTGVPGGIPNRTAICATFSPSATAAAITSAINACNNGVVFLNAGTYTAASLGGTIQVYKSNVTLRGAGADQTILTGQYVVSLGNGYNVSLGTAITGGATKGSTTFTVASTANLSAGTMIEIDRADDTNLVVNTGNQGGGTRNLTQVNMITAVSGNTITVRNPLIYDFSTGSPAVKFYFGGITRNSGVENLKIDHTGFTGGGYNFFGQYCDSCWLKGIESGFATGYHFVFLGMLNMEVRNSFIHDGGYGPDNSGLNFYGNYQYGANSSVKIENNIFNKDFPAISLNNSSSGFYIGYNCEYGTPGFGGGTFLVTWTFDDAHAPFNIMNLYEGNIGEMWGPDSYFGGSGYGTVLRNYFKGYNPNGPVNGDAIQLKRLAYFYNIVGNVIGSTNQNPTAYSTGCNVPNIYELGYPNPGNCSLSPWDNFTPAGGYPDPKVAATLLRWGNYDYFNKATQFNSSEIPSGVPVPGSQAIPNSYYYSSKPAWWPASIAWPPIGPDVTGGNGDTSGHVNKIPAQVCWETRNLLTGGSFNASACYGA